MSKLIITNYRYILLLVLSSLLYACKNEKAVTKPAEGSYQAVVTISAGDVLEENKTFLPLIGNMAKIKSDKGEYYKGIILSKRLKPESRMYIIPIGVLRIIDEDSLNQIIIALPQEKEDRTIDVKNFEEFAVQYSGAKWIIEQWFLNYKGMGKVQFESWESEHYAVNNILKRKI